MPIPDPSDPAAHSQIASVGIEGISAISASDSFHENKKGYMSLEGHTSAVTALAMSIDNTTLVSASSDCSVRIWDTITRQCLRESKPFHKSPLSNVSHLVRLFCLLLYVSLPSCVFPIKFLIHGTMILKNDIMRLKISRLRSLQLSCHLIYTLLLNRF